MSEKKEVKEIEVQGILFNIEGTKAMGKKVFIDTWNAQKTAKDGDGKEYKVRGIIGRFDPEKAWDTMFKKDGPR